MHLKKHVLKYGEQEGPKIIIHVINFKLVQPIHYGTINVTDRQTDGRLTIAVLCFALCASHVKNSVTTTMANFRIK